MAKSLHAVDYLAAVEKHSPRPVCALVGDEAFFQRQALLELRDAVLGTEESDFSYTAFEGRKAEFRDVLEELSTVAMFGGDCRMVVVEEADDFVTRYRQQLEDYVAKPARSGIFVLLLKSLPSNTRLAKAVAADGLIVDCSAPRGAALPRWLTAWAQQFHRFKLAQSAAEMLVEMIGAEVGLLDQELAKLALTAGPNGKITAETVSQSVGGWRAKTAWEMLDAALDGKAAKALSQLDRLLAAGEQPIGVLGQISASLRRFAAATQLIVRATESGHRMTLPAALEQAGVRSFVVKKAEHQLRHLGRQRALMIYDWLLAADLDLKGASALPPRLILERLITRLAAPREATVDSR